MDSSNLRGQIPTQALINPHTNGNCHLHLGKSFLSILTGSRAEKHRRNRKGKRYKTFTATHSVVLAQTGAKDSDSLPSISLYSAAMVLMEMTLIKSFPASNSTAIDGG